MRFLRTIFVLVLFAGFGVQQSMADVFAHHIRLSKEGGQYIVRFVLSDHADSVVVTFKDGSTVLRSVTATDLLSGDQSVAWDGLDDLGAVVPNGDYTVEVTAYDAGYGTYTEIFYDQPSIFTRGVTAVRNQGVRSFGFIFAADGGGYVNGIARHSADGRQWGDVQGNAKLTQRSGTLVGPGSLRFSSEADDSGFIYVIHQNNDQIYRYHADSLDVQMVDSGFAYTSSSWVLNGLAVKTVGGGRQVAVTAARGTTGGADSRIFSFDLPSPTDVHFGEKDTLVSGDSTYIFWDVQFGRNNDLYATFFARGDTLYKPGVAKFDLTGWAGTPFTMADTVWTARMDSGRTNTAAFHWGGNPDGSEDILYFSNGRIATGNPPAVQNIYALTDLGAAQPTLALAYTDKGNNITTIRSDITTDAVGNIVYFENSNEETVVISPPTGPNNYTTTALDPVKVRSSETILAVRVDANADFVPDRLNDTVAVIGIVNGVNLTASANRFSYSIQDDEAGIVITKAVTGGGPVYQVGDRVYARGKLTQFNGTTQIDIFGALADSVELLDQGNVLVPVTVTIAERLANPEAYESRLIEIQGLAKASGTWPATSANATLQMRDGNDTLAMFLDLDTDNDGTTEPVYPVDVVGIATQFDGSAPYSGGYQISPRFRTDFTENVPVAPNTNFAMSTPANGSRIEITDSAQAVTFSWYRAVDLNGDTLIYQWVPVGFTALGTGNASRDTFIVRTGYQIVTTYILAADSVELRWTARAKDAGPIVASVDTFSVWLVNGIISGVEDVAALPTEFALSQNYPNPFNPTTSIRFALPLASNVSLKIYNLLGEEVVTLADEVMNPGYITLMWNGRNEVGKTVASGVYFYRMTAKSVDGSREFVENKKMLLLK